MSWLVPDWRRLSVFAACLWLSACSHNRMVLELRGTVIYEKPEIREVRHTLDDARPEGGRIRVTVTMLGDPGLGATFDITPGIAVRQPMRETEDGHYQGESLLPPDVSGGPYSITGRLYHDKAGEVILRDPATFTIPLLDR
jgi:hypothetical protein